MKKILCQIKCVESDYFSFKLLFLYAFVVIKTNGSSETYLTLKVFKGQGIIASLCTSL